MIPDFGVENPSWIIKGAKVDLLENHWGEDPDNPNVLNIEKTPMGMKLFWAGVCLGSPPYNFNLFPLGSPDTTEAWRCENSIFVYKFNDNPYLYLFHQLDEKNGFVLMGLVIGGISLRKLLRHLASLGFEMVKQGDTCLYCQNHTRKNRYSPKNNE